MTVSGLSITFYPEKWKIGGNVWMYDSYAMPL